MRHPTRYAILAALLAVTATVAAQSPGPGFTRGPDGGWLPPNHPAAQAMTATVALAVPAVPPDPTGSRPTAVACDYVSPYTDRPGCVIGDYRIGQVYQFGASRGLVIGLSMASTGAEIVTVQEVWEVAGGPLQVWAFRNDGSPRPWEWRR